MKTKFVKLTSLSLLVSSTIYAGGYKIPETSLNAVALSAANVAHSISADAAYYNPSNISFMDDKNILEVDLMNFNLDGVHFEGSGTQAGDSIDADNETFFIPSINYISPKLGDFRIGFSMVVPAGLTKKWSDSPAKDKAEEFTLTVIEFNPTLAYQINKQLSIAVGARVVYSEGIVKSSSTISRDMTGDSIDYGYNLALSYKPLKSLEFAITYRSKIDLTEEGNAKLLIGNAKVYDGGSSVSVPLPAALNVAIAYTLPTKTTFEFVYEKTYWSAYNELNFNYTSSISPILVPYFDDPIAKDWVNTNVYRVGLTQEFDKTTLMLGFVKDETPVPDNRVSYELPDTDSISISCGGRYQFSDSLDAGLSMLYSMRDNRVVKNNDIEGTFSNSDVLIISAGIGYKF